MSFYRVRPRFEWKTEKTVQDIVSRLNTHSQKDKVIVMSGIDTHIILTVRDDLQRIWSPYCQLNMEHQEDGTLSVCGLYGPNPNVWTIFIFGYSLLILLTFFISIIGFSQYSLGMDARILWLLPFCILMMAALFIAGFIGQKWGEDQTQLIHQFIEASLEEKIEIAT